MGLLKETDLGNNLTSRLKPSTEHTSYSPVGQNWLGKFLIPTGSQTGVKKTP